MYNYCSFFIVDAYTNYICIATCVILLAIRIYEYTVAWSIHQQECIKSYHSCSTHIVEEKGCKQYKQCLLVTLESLIKYLDCRKSYTAITGPFSYKVEVQIQRWYVDHLRKRLIVTEQSFDDYDTSDRFTSLPSRSHTE